MIGDNVLQPTFRPVHVHRPAREGCGTGDPA